MTILLIVSYLLTQVILSNIDMNYLFSGSSDKNIIVWKIEDNLSYEIIRIIKSNSGRIYY